MGNTKLCFVIASGMDVAHGTEMHTALMLDSLTRANYSIILYVANFNRRKSVWASFLGERKIKVKTPPLSILKRFNFPKKWISRIFAKDIIELSPHFIWAPEEDVVVCFALEKYKSTCPFFVHGNNECSSAYPYYPPLWFKICNKVTGFTTHGERQKQNAIRYFGLTKPVSVVWPASFPPKNHRSILSETTLRFGQFGRIDSMKGSFFAIAAFAKALFKGAKIEYHFFGDGPMRSASEELVRSLGVEESVFFHGRYHPSQLDDLISHIDIGVMPSIFEGFGLVILELMSRGRPVISSDVGSSREILEGLGGGWVVSRADTTDLSELMYRCAFNRETVRTTGDEARAIWLDNFTPDHMLSRYFSFWEQCGLSNQDKT